MVEPTDLEITTLEAIVLDKQSSLTAQLPWRPNPDTEDGINPQRKLLESEAQVIGFGGQAGGGKTDAILGAAILQHRNALVLRRITKNLKGIVRRGNEIFDGVLTHNKVGNFWHGEAIDENGVERPVLFETGGVLRENDKENYRGNPHDLYAFDEVTEFSESAVRFIMGWNRTNIEGQRCRTIMTFNPPSSVAGEWVIRYFGPWLDEAHPNPAEDGEVRYFATLDGVEQEVDSGEPFEYGDDDELITPQSRTFIRSKLSDNPTLRDSTTYRAQLDALPEPLRSQLKHGKIMIGQDDDPFQVIPTAWVLAAVDRWRRRDRPSWGDLVQVGVDVARGGRDQTVICLYFGDWFDDLLKYDGVLTPNGDSVAQLIKEAIKKNPKVDVNIDVIGVGTSAYDSALSHGIRAKAHSGSEKSRYKDSSNKYKMLNRRAEGYWRLREALDPEHGSDICLPDDRMLIADLCSPRFKITASSKIQIEDKKEMKTRLGRSPDSGDALVMSYIPPRGGIIDIG